MGKKDPKYKEVMTDLVNNEYRLRDRQSTKAGSAEAFYIH